MSIQELALQLPRVEKMQLLEALWMDLSGDAKEFESPLWHEALLRQTEQRVASGEEVVVDWDEAKRLLRGEPR
ncbi:addiction module protein [bacterium]|nr:addiction module protein [bacterium]